MRTAVGLLIGLVEWILLEPIQSGVNGNGIDRLDTVLVYTRGRRDRLGAYKVVVRWLINKVVVRRLLIKITWWWVIQVSTAIIGLVLHFSNQTVDIILNHSRMVLLKMFHLRILSRNMPLQISNTWNIL